MNAPEASILACGSDPPRSQRRDQSHRWQQDVLADVYVFPVSVDPAVARVRFSRVIQRVLDGARVQGLTDKDISKRTGVGSSTFHRWRVGDFSTAPDMQKIIAFCEGLGVPAEPALRALGLDDGRDDPAPDPPMDPDIRKIQRALNDPNVLESEKNFAREMLKMISSRITKSRS